MKKVSLVAPVSCADGVIRVLQDVGVVEIEQTEIEPEEHSWCQLSEVRQGLGKEQEELSRALTELKFCIDFFDRFERIKKNIIEQFAGGKVYLPGSTFDDLGSKVEEAHAVYEECRRLDEELSKRSNEEARLLDNHDQLIPWEWLDIPVSKLAAASRISVDLYTFPSRFHDNIATQLKESCPRAHLVPGLSPGSRNIPVMVICLSEDRDEVRQALSAYSILPELLPEVQGTPKEAIGRIEQRLSEIDREVAELNEQAKGLLKERIRIYSAYDRVSLALDRKTLAAECPATRTAFLIEGWVCEDTLPEVEKAVQSEYDLVHVEARDPFEDENPPVILDNPARVAPFEAVTEVYGMPRPGTLDPSFAAMPFFFIFFGMALGDAGYGIILSIVCLLLLRKIRMAGTAEKLFKMMAICGAACVLVGAVTGSWFGDLFGIAPIWFSPLDDPLLMLIVSFALGLVQIYVGIGMKLYYNIRQGNLKEAIFDQGLWYPFLTGFLLLLGGSALGNPTMSQVGKWLAIAGAGGLIATQGRAHKNIIKRLGSGILSLYDLTGYVSDILSYSRLLALGLASSVIAMVVNDMAKRFLSIRFVGWIPMLVVLVIGHVFNLAINVIGSYVHSSRLQYVEFYGKFFEGGGRRFRPFSKKTKYIEIVEEGEA
ncbi:MAG: V-type ATP synthase subunit I [Firmicutes bacterium]|jgi:V/A-type H+-transporting ATPase subunit I|nr:V-type ATP synthase subunit I [Bacillota bacterium]